MISQAALENALWTWVAAGSGLASDRVFHAHQDLPISEIVPRAVIRMGGTKGVGQQVLTHDYSDSRPAGQELEFTSSTHHELVVEVQTFALATVGDGPTARTIAMAVQASLGLPSIREALNAAGIGVLDEGEIQRIPQVLEAETEDRAVLSVRLLVTQSISERTTYIEHVETTTTVT